MPKTPKDKKIGFTVVLSPEQFAALKALALKESRPLAQMARVIIEKYLKKEGE
jgi:predicted DNA-binding protein